jgi:uncharacterized protein
VAGGADGVSFFTIQYVEGIIMTTQERRIGKHFRELLERRIEPLTVRAFGSRTRGDAEMESDFDILVVVDNLDTDTHFYVSECAWEAGFDEGVIVSPLVYSRAAYAIEAHSPLGRAIEQDGEAL